MTAYRSEVLPDGSVAEADHFDLGPNGSIVSRLVDGVVVWGQVFSRNDDHAAQVEDVFSHMRANPAAFKRYPGRQS